MLQALTVLGYKVKEKAEVKGKSGAECTFDILADLDDGFIARRLGIDIISDNEVTLNQVSLFDTTSYDVGIQGKILLISGELAPEAKQFAEQQRIKVIKLGSQTEELLAKGEVPQ